jgi:hypothetical protein
MLRLGHEAREGLYVPSRDASLGKTERKRRWLDSCTAALVTNGHTAGRTLLASVIHRDRKDLC